MNEFYDEVKEIKRNRIDSMLNAFSRDRDIDKEFSEQEDKLKELKISKQSIIEEYKKEYIKYIKSLELE